VVVPANALPRIARHTAKCDNFRVPSSSQNPKPATSGREHYRLMTPTVEIQRHAVVDPRRADVREQISNSAAQLAPITRLVGHFRSSLTYCFWQGSARGGEFVEELGEIPTSELPFKRSSCGFPIVLKVQEALGESVEIGKVVGG
jgi:hypothetical protein